jgi:hypothetical protein
VQLLNARLREVTIAAMAWVPMNDLAGSLNAERHGLTSAFDDVLRSGIVDDGTVREEVLLDPPDVALHMPPLVWGMQFGYSEDAVLVVFASHRYDPIDYIRDDDSFMAEVHGAAPSRTPSADPGGPDSSR